MWAKLGRYARKQHRIPAIGAIVKRARIIHNRSYAGNTQTALIGVNMVVPPSAAALIPIDRAPSMPY